MNFNTLISLTVNGFAMGMIYALMAMGIILLIRAVGVMNFAQGDLLMMGAFITCWLTIDIELPLYVMIPLALVCFAVLALVFMFTVYWPLRNASYPAATIISTMGAAMALKEIATLVWGSLPRSMPPLMKNADTGKAAVLKVGTVTLQWQYVLTILVGAVLIIGVFVLFEKLYAGRMMQAAAQDSYAAELLGIPTILTTAATYIIVVILSGVGGYMISPIFMVSNTLGSLQLRSFAGVVLGGFGNIKGAIIGSLVIGLVESYASIQFSQYKDAVVFLVLIAVLLIRPQGLFGEKIADKA
ncbi:branched-chain amino acid ABC transporter permease [Agathobaculum sp.]|uniref:branched-chain amino acid ABC transporter permease n=1 Tax=Agathobaculum sp. TaxID=2048138 RepID=UPI002A823C32|nr:branched-chain amino acid ABC transporter permease [Agathobaculum sp.]MDY3617609.1 branched-chain amino acid ABC transporter permease [Agathobaculum sp.]